MKRKFRKHCFTLLEVLVSMGVFAILMLALLQFFTAAQNVWSKSGAKMDTFADVRTAMDMMAMDLNSAYYEYNHSNKLAYFYLRDATKSDTDDPFIKFALATIRQFPKKDEASRLTEVRYSYDSDNLNLKVQVISDKDVTSSDAWATKEQNAEIASGGKPEWVKYMGNKKSETDDKGEQILVSNVVNFEIKCYDLKGNSLEKIPSGGTTLPYRVDIKLAVVNNETLAKLKARGKGVSDIHGIYTSGSGEDYELLKQGLTESARVVLIERMQYQ